LRVGFTAEIVVEGGISHGVGSVASRDGVGVRTRDGLTEGIATDWVGETVFFATDEVLACAGERVLRGDVLGCGTAFARSLIASASNESNAIFMTQKMQLMK
jgi:hypothetical protein